MAYRDAHAENVVRVELIIVGDEVVVRFGADEECSPEVVADADSEMNGKTRIVDQGAAAIPERAAARIVKHHGLAARAGHEVGTDLRRQSAGVHAIHVVQKRSIVLESVIKRFFNSSRAFYVQPEPFLTEILQTRIGIDAALQCRREKRLGSSERLLRPHGAAPDCEINLLGAGKAPEAGEHARQEWGSEGGGNSQFFHSPLIDTSSQSSWAWSRKPVEKHSGENWELRSEDSWHRPRSFTLDQWYIRLKLRRG